MPSHWIVLVKWVHNQPHTRTNPIWTFRLRYDDKSVWWWHIDVSTCHSSNSNLTYVTDIVLYTENKCYVTMLIYWENTATGESWVIWNSGAIKNTTISLPLCGAAMWRCRNCLEILLRVQCPDIVPSSVPLFGKVGTRFACFPGVCNLFT
jgi:hypothetical protein